MVDDYVKQEIKRLYDLDMLIIVDFKSLVYGDIYYVELGDKYYEVLEHYRLDDKIIREVTPRIIEITEWDYV
jgi:hypothetical protein